MIMKTFHGMRKASGSNVDPTGFVSGGPFYGLGVTDSNLREEQCVNIRQNPIGYIFLVPA